jgi:mannosyltransferase
MRVIRIAILGAALLLGAFLRFDGIGDPSFWIDEILHQRITTGALDEPWWKWITGFEPENGPLYYATQLATRIAGTSEGSARGAAALFGLAAIGMVWLASTSGAGTVPTSRDDDWSRRPTWDAGIAALLLAVSPLHVYYSREARPYALLMLLTAAMILILLRGRSRMAAFAVMLAMAYTAAVAAPVLVGTAMTAGLLALVHRDRRRFDAPVALLAVAVLALQPLLYRGVSAPLSLEPPVYDVSFLSALIRHFSVTALDSQLGGRTAAGVLAFAVIGAVVLFRRERRTAIVLLGMTSVPLVVALSALLVFDRWYAVRYVTPALIGYLLLAAAGIRETTGALTRLLFRGRPIAAPIAALFALGVAAIVADQAWHACRTEAWQKLHWRLIAEKIVDQAHPGDLLLAAEPWSGLPLDFYLARMPDKVEDLTITDLPLAKHAASGTRRAWLVSAGSPADQPVRAWMCTQPLVLASAIDNFRMHYTGDFLRERSREPEHRALSAALGDAILFGDGWASEEGEGEDAFRWAVAEEATLIVPVDEPRDRLIPLRVTPHMHPSLPQQRIRVSVNGALVTELPLPNAPSTPDLAIPRRFWVRGVNTMTLRFAYAVAPAELPGTNRDARKLAVAVHLPRTTPHVTRIASLPLADESNSWRRSNETRFPASTLRRDAVLPMLGRLGFDPSTTWPRIERGEVQLEELAESLAYASDCADDGSFVRHSFELLLGRAPGKTEENDLIAKLEEGMSRPRLITRIVRFEEFRKSVTR